MPKLAIAMILMVLLVVECRQSVANLEVSGRSSATGRRDESLAEKHNFSNDALIYNPEKRSVGVQWVASRGRNRVVFTPAPTFLVFLGAVGAASLGIPLIRLARTI